MDPRVKGFLWRGLAAGAAGGVASAAFLLGVTERQIDLALRFEEAAGLGLPPGEAALFGRDTQRWGGAVGAVFYGVVFGLVLAVALLALHHRIRARNEFERAAKLAAAGFVALVLLPALKYPPNPPAVGNPDTINERTSNYLLLLVASVVVVAGAAALWGWLTERGWTAAPRFAAAGGAFAVAVGVLLVAFPASPDPIVAPDNEAAPALRIAEGAPPEVLDAWLAAARQAPDRSVRDPADPDLPLALDTVGDPAELAGAPVAVSTAELVEDPLTTVVWHFRLASLAGLALMWAVMATVFGLLADAPRPLGRARRRPGIATAG